MNYLIWLGANANEQIEWIYWSDLKIYLRYELSSQRTSVLLGHWISDLSTSEIEVSPIANLTPKIAKEWLARLKQYQVYT